MIRVGYKDILDIFLFYIYLGFLPFTKCKIEIKLIKLHKSLLVVCKKRFGEDVWAKFNLLWRIGLDLS